MKIKEKPIAILERWYPTIIALLLVAIYFFCYKKFHFSFSKSNNFKDALIATITFTSIIIGFIGAMITAIVSIKEESTMVKYFFDSVDKKYFMKITKKEIMSGTVTAFISIVLTLVSGKIIIEILTLIWIFLICYFLASTYRLLSCLINLLILQNSTKQSEKYSATKEEKQNLINELKKY